MDNSTILVLADPNERPLALLEALPPGTSLVVGNRSKAFEGAAEEADVIFNWSQGRELLEAVWRMTPRVQWVHTRAAGLDGLLFPELVASSVPLTNGRGVFSESLAEFVLGAVLFFAKDFRRMIHSQEQGRWDRFDIEEISGRTMGIVGYGDIGRACASRAKAMGMTVLALRRRPQLSAGDPWVAEVLPLSGLMEMIPRCDYVVATAPLTADTLHLIGEKVIGAMKPSAVLINVGRGHLVDEHALVLALDQRRIRGAALDVFEQEPLPEGHPFYRLNNLLLSAHSADHTADWLEQSMKFFIANFERYHDRKPLLNVVDKKAGY